jgi:serine/threonine protein kinase
MLTALQDVIKKNQTVINDKLKYQKLSEEIYWSYTSDKINPLMDSLTTFTKNSLEKKGKTLNNEESFTTHNREILSILLAKYIKKQLQENTDIQELSFSIIDALLDHKLNIDIKNESYETKLGFLASAYASNNNNTNQTETDFVAMLLDSKDQESINISDPIQEEHLQITLDSYAIESLKKSINKIPKKEDINKFEDIVMHNEPGYTIMHDTNGNTYVYNQASPLGAGSNGKVFLAIDIKTGKKLVIKKIDKTTTESIGLATNEYHKSLAYKVKGQSLAQNFGTDDSSNMIIVSQFLEGYTPFGDNLIAEKNIAPEKRESLLKQVSAIAKEIHRLHTEFNIYHGDITPENIFINNQDPNDPTAALIDFGMGKDINNKPHLTGYSPIYTAPEVFVEIFRKSFGIDDASKPINIEAFNAKMKDRKDIVTEPLSTLEYRREKIEQTIENVSPEERKDLEKQIKELDEQMQPYLDNLKILENLEEKAVRIVNICNGSWSKSQKNEMLMLQIKDLYKQQNELLDLDYIEFPYTEKQEVYSFGKVLINKGLAQVPELSKLIAEMTSPILEKRPTMKEIVQRLDNIDPKQVQHYNQRPN